MKGIMTAISIVAAVALAAIIGVTLGGIGEETAVAPAASMAEDGSTASVATVARRSAESPPNRIRIDSGSLIGERGDGVVSFKGVPFAQPPVGELRWKPPQPIRWSGARDATDYALPCPQPVPEDGTNGGGVSGPTSEDCLYLNVWAPENVEDAPVMLWLYGGAGYLGGGHLATYDGTSFAERGVILVTINYRLGALGNFAHPALTATAGPDEGLVNYALMDAIAGLDWVQRNIETLGGDPDNVTLFGQSAGGAMVSRLLSSPPAEGLFHKAIIHSGTRIDDELDLAGGEAWGIEAATALGLSGAEATAEELRAIPAEAFVENEEVRRGVRGVLDGRIKTVSTREGFASGATFDVPLIAGSNNGEGGADRAHEIVELARSGAPSFQYYFTYVPEALRDARPDGAPHSAELRYAFDTVRGDITAQDRRVASDMNSCWVAFAKAPVTARSLTCADGFVWEARSMENEAIAVFGDSPRMDLASPILAAAGS